MTSCESTKSTSDSIMDEKFELCSKLKYDSLITKYGSTDKKLIYQQQNIHSIFENFMLREKYLREVSKEGYSELLDEVKGKEIKPEFFQKFKKELGFDPYLLFPINSHYSCYSTLIEHQIINSKSGWQSRFLDAYWRYEASGDITTENSSIKDALNYIPDDKFEKIIYRKLFIDLIYVHAQG
jgi:hypothetical protein